MIDLQIHDSIDEIAARTFELLLEAGETCRPTAAALSFGSTYDSIFQTWKELFDMQPKRPGLPAFFPVDERLVELTAPDSNWGMVRSSFLNSCGSYADKNRWAADADTFRGQLSKYFDPSRKAIEFPIFNLIFLGLGPDGHTASLFPDDCPKKETPEWSNWILETTAPFTPPNRLTLGPELIARSEKLVLTVTGSTKANIFTRLYDELNSESEHGLLPPALILRRREELGLDTIILSDKSASKYIEKNNDF